LNLLVPWLVRGKCWSVDEERLLRRLVEEGKSLGEIAAVMGKSREAVRQKKFNLGLWGRVEEQRTRLSKSSFVSSRLEAPPELPNVEESVKILASAMLKSVEPGLGSEEIRRLQVVADLATRYRQAYAEYMDYRGVEQRLTVLEQKYEAEHKAKKRPLSQDLPGESG
jgi:hypothetical protein